MTSSQFTTLNYPSWLFINTTEKNLSFLASVTNQLFWRELLIYSFGANWIDIPNTEGDSEETFFLLALNYFVSSLPKCSMHFNAFYQSSLQHPSCYPQQGLTPQDTVEFRRLGFRMNLKSLQAHILPPPFCIQFADFLACNQPTKSK